ncbi:class GN sortase [Shewanella baltica]|jgi:sortase A|uniref:Class GN sortase n=1 Tax=Shewanella scandinavica TaxID=3063538 RepID=A0ABU3FXD3_9GAMM|nr:MULTISPECIES: class GN sortase [Shewanella]MCS6136109.1 class GN sortase [Shewanella baltica]MCS6234761.1 class GN sortase [Shewanella baltica]MCS6261121.1 class GN sortase [Shewanella baltica]MCS6269019.1 class GN sortase [Shewanella baltica]MDT3280005.1 class GN sortase [Shewanella sp. SP2S1-2]
MSKGRTQRFLVVGLFLIGATLLGKGLYMQAKAHFAQYLIEQAWTKTLADGQSHKPWSWADTYPVAKLSIYREQAAANSDIEAELNDSLYVLAGASGRNLAFGPSLVLSSAPAGQKGNTVIAGHRDTHFAILNGMAVGRRLSLQTLKGNNIIYEVVATQVVHETETQFMAPSADNRLTLITCYPFDALQGGAELRFVVQAIPVEDESMDTASADVSASIGNGIQGKVASGTRSFTH